MGTFIKATWHIFRTETGDNRRMRWSWAVVAVALFALIYASIYCLVAPVCALVRWLDRRERCPGWLRRFGGPAANMVEGVFFTKRKGTAAGDMDPRDGGEDLASVRDGTPLSGKFELFRVENCVEPCRVGGPYCDDETLVVAARRTRAKHGDADVLLAGWIDNTGRPTLASFSEDELEPSDRQAG